MPTEPLSIIVIGAHMDDCWIGGGATCLKAARQGHRVTFLTAISSYRHLWYVKGRETQIHPKLGELCARHGIRHIQFGHDYMRLVNTPEMVDQIAQVLKDLNGDILFCHAEDENNQDHTALGAASRIAALHGECFLNTDRGDTRLPWEIYQYTTGWQSTTFRPDTFVDVTDTMLDALEICRTFDEIYADGRWETRQMTITDHKQRDRSVYLTGHARFKFAQAIVNGGGSGYAEGFSAYTRRALGHRKLARI